jgi:hypothetical protein
MAWVRTTKPSRKRPWVRTTPVEFDQYELAVS